MMLIVFLRTGVKVFNTACWQNNKQSNPFIPALKINVFPSSSSELVLQKNEEDDAESFIQFISGHSNNIQYKRILRSDHFRYVSVLYLSLFHPPSVEYSLSHGALTVLMAFA